jgi:hypothetical protein
MRKYDFPDTSPPPPSTGGGMLPPPSCDDYAFIARVNTCYNLDGSASQYVQSGSVTGTGWGCTETEAKTNARTSLSTALNMCVNTPKKNGCCTYTYEAVM